MSVGSTRGKPTLCFVLLCYCSIQHSVWHARPSTNALYPVKVPIWNPWLSRTQSRIRTAKLQYKGIESIMEQVFFLFGVSVFLLMFCVCVCVCIYLLVYIYKRSELQWGVWEQREEMEREECEWLKGVHLSKMNISTEKWDFTFLRALPFGDLLFVKIQFYCYLTLELYNKECCSPSVSTRIKSLATPVIDQQCILKGIQDEKQDAALYALENRPLS